MMPKQSKFGFITVLTRSDRDDTLQGIFARSKRKSKVPVTMPKKVGDEKAKEENTARPKGRAR